MAQTERLSMAEGTAGSEEALPVSQTTTSPETRKAQVLANASLEDQERLQHAKELLETQLTQDQEKAILEAHKVGIGEEGKEGPAGVFNYKLHQIGKKLDILEKAGFTKEQRFALIKSGLAGTLPPSEFTALTPDDYSDPKVKRIVERLKTAGDVGKVDEVFIYKIRAQVKKLDDAAEIDPGEAEDFLVKLEGWQSKADDFLLPYSERIRVEEQARREGGSEFSMVKALYEYYNSINISPLTPVQQAEVKNRIDTYKTGKTGIKNLINEAGQLEVLDDVRTRALDFYRQVKAAKRHDKWGRDKQQIIDYARKGYDEAFWEDSPALKQLEGRFRGVAKYIWDGIVSETYKEVNKEELPALNAVAEEEFGKIQELRRILRLGEKKYETSVYYGRRNYELTAENAGELPSAILGWIRDQLAELPDTDMQTTDGKLKEIRAEAEQLLGTRRSHLETEEGQDVPETHPDFLRAKAMAEAVTDSVGYEKIISWDEKIAYEGGGEIAASYAEKFASNYIGHHDSIYLMPRLARILLKLRTHKEGTYWTGHPFSEEKVNEGYTRKYRQQLQEEIIEDAVTHDLFIDEWDFRKRNQDHLIDPEGEDLRYSFDDNIEKMLLDLGDIQRQEIIASGDANALRRHDIRVKVFRDIKERLDAKEGWAGYTEQQRKNAVRQKIIQQMKEKTDNSHFGGITNKAMVELNNARLMGDATAFDRIMWKWVEEYNNYRIKEGLHIDGDAAWYPSGWDRVRMKIDRPEKVLDRQLSDEQIDAMYEKMSFDKIPYSDPIKEAYIKHQIAHAMDESRFGFQLARSYSMLEMEDVMYGGIRTRIRDPKTGEPVNPHRKVERVFDIVQKRLEKAIAEEEAELNQLKTTKQAEIRQAKQLGNFSRAKELQIELDKKILGAQFLATHALKAAGFVDGKLPVWDGQLTDPSTINFFGETLAAYGVNVAYAEAISHNSKDWLYEIIERGRRGWQSEWNIAAREYMVGTYPVIARDEYGNPLPSGPGGKPVLAKAYRKNAFREEATISERDRIVNTGIPREHRGIIDTRFQESTSGGLAVPEFIDEIGDLLFAPPMAKLGVVGIAGLHGYIKRRDEVEAGEQRLFTSMDAVYSASERAEAYKARKTFSGGKIAQDKSTPGFGNEPYHGGFKVADWLHEQFVLAKRYELDDTANYLALMQEYRKVAGKMPYSQFIERWSGKITGVTKGSSKDMSMRGQDLERLRQLSYLDLGKMDKPMVDQFYQTMYTVLDYFQDYLKARKGVVQSRGGRALRSWEEENHKAFYAFRREMREAVQGKKDANGDWDKRPEHGFIIRLGYSPEVASEIAIQMMETALKEADYLILGQYEVDRRVDDGEEIISKVLSDKEKQDGFVIPDEKDWANLRPEIQKALKTIRRRGLLEFMTEEGYKIYDRDSEGNIKTDPKTGGRAYFKEILGKKVPPLVQQLLINNDRNLVANP